MTPRPGDAYMHKWTWSSMVWVMASRQWGTKLSLEPMLSFGKLDPRDVLQLNLNQNTKFSLRLAYILSRTQWNKFIKAIHFLWYNLIQMANDHPQMNIAILLLFALLASGTPWWAEAIAMPYYALPPVINCHLWSSFLPGMHVTFALDEWVFFLPQWNLS